MKTVLITGSSKGLGKELANVFTENDYKVITHGREGVVDLYGDLRNENTINKLIKMSKEKNLDLLINNAGLLFPGSPFEEITEEQISEILSVNLIAPIKLIRGVYPFFIERGYGDVININSDIALRESYQKNIYSASKGGLRGFSLGLKREAKEKGVNIIDFYPGKIKNYKKVAGEIYKEYKKLK